MRLPAVSFADILVFLACLTLRIIFSPHLFLAITTVLRALPFLLFQLPAQLFRERWVQPQKRYGADGASFFQTVVLKCMRYSFVHLPIPVARCFFHRSVVLPFYYWRVLRAGKLWDSERPTWREVEKDSDELLRCELSSPSHPPPRGIWIQHDHATPPDIAILYFHGGGFALGSPWFYVEFLTIWCSLLRTHHGFRNPAIFAVEYSLSPEATYPTQVREAEHALEYVLGRMHGWSERVVVAGDSAGGVLALDVLRKAREKVGYGVLISPWAEVVGGAGSRTGTEAPEKAEAVESTPQTDYLELERLEELGKLYSGDESPRKVSPALWEDMDAWRRGMPLRGISIYYAEQEVLGDGIRRLVRRLRQAGEVKERRIGGVHAWVVASMFLGHSWEERSAGIQLLCADVERALRADAAVGKKIRV